MSSRLRSMLLAFVIMLASASAWATVQVASPDTSGVPPALTPWIDWVLKKHPELACPVNVSDETRRCVWPSAMSLTLNESGGRFAQTVQAYTKSRLVLPGSVRQWPVNVMINGEPAVVVSVKGHPAVDVQPGEWQLTGEFEWQRLPDSLDLGESTGIVSLAVNGRVVTRPDRRAGRVWLADGRTVKQQQAPNDSMNIEVARLVQDGHPLKVVTAITLRVSGKQREINLANVLLSESIALSLKSTLPARLEADGSLRVQVRPGTFNIEVTARRVGQVSSLEARRAGEGWPAEEIWLWQAAPQMRVAEIVDAVQIDPRQAPIPSRWANLPAYRVNAGDTFQIKTLRRGDPTPEPDQLTLNRELWLDFDGGGLSVRDRLSGRLTRTWRLESDEAMALGQVKINNQAQFITTAENSNRSGVEVRRGKLNMQADARIAPPEQAGAVSKTLPVVGWTHDFQKVSATLHTPPGWRVLSVSGVDSAPGAWLEAWSLYDLFLVLIIAVSIARLWGWPWAIAAAVMLTLLWHEPGAPRLVWLAALVPIALLRVVPPAGKLASSLKVLRALTLLLLILACLPFVIDQARTALHPQLEATRHAAPVQSRKGGSASDMAAEAVIEQESRVEDVAPRYSSNRVKKQGSGPAYAPSSAREKDLSTLRSIDPDAIVQTGSGVPDWQWRSVRLTFNGPVLASQSMTLRLLSPRMKQVVQGVMLLLLALVLWRLLEVKPSAMRRWRVEHVAALFLVLQLTPGEAAQFPSEKLLQELEQRLLKPQTRAPRAAISDMRLRLTEQRLSMVLSVNASATTALPLPADARRLMPTRVTMNGQATDSRILGDQKGQLWLLVPAGEHEVRLEIPLPQVNQISLSLPLKPHRIQADASDWTISGIDENGVARNQVTLTRKEKASKGDSDKLESRELPPLLAVTRTLQLGLNWEVQTVVERHSPRGFPINNQVALLPGEKVISSGIETRDGQVLIKLRGNDRRISWRSRLDPVDALTLTAATDPQMNETWRLQASPIWRVSTDGIAPMYHQDAQQNWLPTWKPWAGETVALSVSRPTGIGGQSLTIDQSRLQVEPGVRASDATLEFRLRSSQGVQHPITLPEGATLQSVTINGQSKPLRPTGNELILPVVPGQQKVALKWRQDIGVDNTWHSPVVDLGSPHVNSRLAVVFPKDRWTLWTDGPRLGPAVLIWGVLAVLLVLSIALAKASAKQLPLGVVSWFLLAIGLSQVTVFAWILVVVWLFLLAARPRLADNLEPFSHNSLQIVIAGLTVLSLGILLWAVQQGLLGRPEMQIAGYGSSAYRLNWYADRSDALMPQATVVSAPLWVYRVLMLAWALWLAWSLLNWLRWGWQQFATGDLWRPTTGLWRKPKPSPPDGPQSGAVETPAVDSEAPAQNVSKPAGNTAADSVPSESPSEPPSAEPKEARLPAKGDESDLAALAAKALSDKQNKR
ncbi:MAG: hypothetical protein AB8C46_04755 [Burkholderiaceae bacterium]